MSLKRTLLRGVLRNRAGKTVKGPYHPTLRAKMHAERREKLERKARKAEYADGTREKCGGYERA